MADFLRAHQLNIMLALSSMCMLIAFFAAITKTLSARRKMALIYLEISAAVLLMADRYAYIFRGDETRHGFWMVRVTNFLVFMMTALRNQKLSTINTPQFNFIRKHILVIKLYEEKAIFTININRKTV